MKLFFDAEFTGLRKDTTLISIGIVSEDNRQFYAELTDYNKELCNSWIKENVIKHLVCENPESLYVPNYHIGTKDDIATALKIWLKQFDYIEFVSDVCHYDFVLLIDLFGTAFDLPESVCPSCYDINQDIARQYSVIQKEAFNMSREDILYNNWKDSKVKGEKHNALYDAKVIRELYQIMNSVKFD